ncbi:MAG TPA: DUF983 domain-containing protein [Opitutaceae bacterium]|nr:DUF983 domain-containing protein [Opitutaceae bacterium]
MNVNRGQIVARGLANRCPNCGAPTLFPPAGILRVNRRCANCGLRFDRGEGFFLGPFVINYGVTAFGFVVPLMLCYFFHILSGPATLILAGLGAVGLPLLLYRRSWSWWLMVYFYFLPQKLPYNHDELREDEEE